MFITPAYAQDFTSSLGGAAGLLPLVAIFVVFYFLLIRPQQQRQKETREMLAALKRGDRVVTGGGIVGVITRVPPAGQDGKPMPEVEVEIAPNIRVTVMRDTITTVIRPVVANDVKPAKATKRAS